MRVLQVAAELFPLVKTGGLADVLGALPQALARAGADVRLLLPGLPAVMQGVQGQKTVCEIGAMFGAARIRLLLGELPGTGLSCYLVDAPYLYQRQGNPYLAPDGAPWPDNLQRFALLGWVGAHLASAELDPPWKPDVLHAHDWHSALACAYVATHPGATAATVFTVHNLAYQGLFELGDYALLGLPARLLAPEGLEFHGQFSFMKAGLAYAHRITTVSPSYAREIAGAEFGCGLDGLVRARGSAVSGILNGVDGATWNPQSDHLIAQPYSVRSLAGKAACKAALQQSLGLELDPRAPLFGVVSRLTAQKGLDLVLEALPEVLPQGAQLALLGSGDADLQDALSRAAAAHPGQVALRLGYDEAFAHAVIAGSDALLVPSRFEPCGLTQMYALRYGSVPLVRRVGGLIDTVVDAAADPARDRCGTGFMFGPARAHELVQAMTRAIGSYRDPVSWRALQKRGMAQDFSWDSSAASYMALYRAMLAEPAHRSQAGASDLC